MAASAVAGGPESSERRLRMGVLAIQGGFEAHRRTLERLGVEAFEVREAAQLDELDALVIPGGETTTIVRGIAADRIEQPLREFVATGKPTLGTCAGMILLDERHLGLLDIRTNRNAYGRQIRSFEAPVRIAGVTGDPFIAVFIRAPRVVSVGGGVEVLAEFEDEPVVVRQGNVLATSFHPELTDDLRLHALFGEIVAEHVGAGEHEEALR